LKGHGGVLAVTQADREAAVGALQRAAGDGRLPLEDFSERVGIALAAETRDQLDAATAGLAAAAPDGPALTASAAPTRRPWRRR